MEIQVTERRSRTRRKKTGVNIALSPDFDVRRILLPLYRHGKLPTAYLLAFRGGSYTAGRNRLTKLYHETAGENAHLIHRISRTGGTSIRSIATSSTILARRERISCAKQVSSASIKTRSNKRRACARW